MSLLPGVFLAAGLLRARPSLGQRDPLSAQGGAALLQGCAGAEEDGVVIAVIREAERGGRGQEGRWEVGVLPLLPDVHGQLPHVAATDVRLQHGWKESSVGVVTVRVS